MSGEPTASRSTLVPCASNTPRILHSRRTFPGYDWPGIRKSTVKGPVKPDIEDDIGRLWPSAAGRAAAPVIRCQAETRHRLTAADDSAYPDPRSAGTGSACHAVRGRRRRNRDGVTSSAAPTCRWRTAANGGMGDLTTAELAVRGRGLAGTEEGTAQRDGSASARCRWRHPSSTPLHGRRYGLAASMWVGGWGWASVGIGPAGRGVVGTPRPTSRPGSSMIK
jgi:hypothetical protein